MSDTLVHCQDSAFCRSAQCRHHVYHEAGPYEQVLHLQCTDLDYCAQVGRQVKCLPVTASQPVRAAWTYAPADGVSHD